jgi:hypothetical protein
VDGVVRVMRIAYLQETTRNWRAGCCESSKPWFGEGRTEKVWLHRTSLTVYSTLSSHEENTIWLGRSRRGQLRRSLPVLRAGTSR